MPEEAGQMNPCAWLPPERRVVVENLELLQGPQDLWGELIVACHRVPPDEEAALVSKMLETKMVELIPESELPRNDEGDLMPGGLFCVRENEKEDRLIFGRRPEKAMMGRLGWAELPNGACFCRMLLAPNEYLRASGDDFRNFDFLLRMPPTLARFNAVDRTVDPAVVELYGKDPRIPHRGITYGG